MVRLVSKSYLKYKSSWKSFTNDHDPHKWNLVSSSQLRRLMFFCRNQPLSPPQSANQDTDDDDLTSPPRKKLPHLILPLMKNTDNCTFHVWLNILIISSIVVWSNAQLISVTWLDCTMAWWVNSPFWHQFARHHHRWKICGRIVFIWQSQLMQT